MVCLMLDFALVEHEEWEMMKLESRVVRKESGPAYSSVSLFRSVNSQMLIIIHHRAQLGSHFSHFSWKKWTEGSVLVKYDV